MPACPSAQEESEVRSLDEPQLPSLKPNPPTKDFNCTNGASVHLLVGATIFPVLLVSLLSTTLTIVEQGVVYEGVQVPDPSISFASSHLATLSPQAWSLFATNAATVLPWPWNFL